MPKRMVVAFEEVESPQARMWRHCAGGAVTEDDLCGKPVRLGRFWCAADKPIEDDDFRLVRVYRTHVVPEDARCEDCAIPIRELQEAMTQMLRSAGVRRP
jgi:hypothetical protein